MTTRTEDTRSLLRNYIERVWIEQDLDALHDFLAPDPAFQAAIRGHLEQLFGALSELRITVHQILVDDEDAAVRATIAGRHTGDLAGVAPTGRRVEYDTMRTFHVHGGRITATYAIQDRLLLLQQLGAVGELPGVNWGTHSTTRD